MKQFYSYDAGSSEITERAGSIEDLLKKLKTHDDQDWFNESIGLINEEEPLYFYEKKDVHGDDDDAREINIKRIQSVAKNLNLC